MQVSKIVVAPFLALALVGSTAACGSGELRPPKPNCAFLEVAEYDEDGWECEPDRNKNGVDDENEKKKSSSILKPSTKKKSSTSKTTTRKTTTTTRKK